MIRSSSSSSSLAWVKRGKVSGGSGGRLTRSGPRGLAKVEIPVVDVFRILGQWEEVGCTIFIPAGNVCPVGDA